MDDHELDRLLATQVQPLRADTDAAVFELVRAARVEVVATSPRRRQRRRLFVGGVVLGAVVLTGGGTLTAAQLGMPPFQALEPGVQRVQAPIAVDYVSVTGKNVQCEAFLEFRHLSQDQLDGARTYVAARDWSSTGQQAYDTAKDAAKSSEPDAVDQAFNEVPRMWMFGIARKVLAGGYRSARRRQALTDRLREELSYEPDIAGLDGSKTIDAEGPRREQLTLALDQLKPSEREIVRLVHWDEFTLSEAAQHLRLRLSTTRSRYYRARDRLKELLEQP